MLPWDPRPCSWRRWLPLMAAAGSWLITLLILPAPIPQWQSYHEFADRRRLFDCPNLLNVISNLPFLFVGLMGLRFCQSRLEPIRRLPWVCFFSGVAFVSAGSAYYHWSPTDLTLAWDRLPLTLAFMSLVVALVGEFDSERAAQWLLGPALLMGGTSVAWWLWFDDVRFYGWVQFMPLLIIPLLALNFDKGRCCRRPLAMAAGCYLVAKAFEFWDRPVLELTGGIVSGHSIKHIVAGVACWVVYKTLVKLRMRESPPAAPDGDRFRAE